MKETVKKIFIKTKDGLLLIGRYIKKIATFIWKWIAKFVKKHKKLSIFLLSFLILILTLIIVISVILNKEDPLSTTEIPVNNVEIAEEQTAVYLDNIGDSHLLVANVYPQNAFNKNIKWTSSNEEVVSVDENGLVTVLRLRNPGEEDVRIVVETIDGGFTDSIKIIVPVLNDYEKLICDYINSLEVELINKKEILFSEISIVMNDKIQIPSITNKFGIISSEYEFVWEEVSPSESVIVFDKFIPSSGETIIIPNTLGTTNLVFKCLKNGKEIISKDLQINVVVEDVLEISYTGLNDSYKKGEIINNNAIVITAKYRDLYGDVYTREINYNKIDTYKPLTTSTAGENNIKVKYGNKNIKFIYNVEDSTSYKLTVENLKQNYCMGESVLSSKVVVEIDGAKYLYNLLDVDSNVKEIDMNTPGGKTLIINYMDSVYSYNLNVIDDDREIKVTGLYNKYPLNSKLDYESIIVNVDYVNDDYYLDIEKSLNSFYKESELDGIFNTSVLGKHTVSLKINSDTIVFEYDVVDEIVNVDFEFLIPIENEYTINDEVLLSIKPIYSGYTLDFNIDDVLVYINNEKSNIGELTKSSGAKSVKFVYGDEQKNFNVYVNHYININYYIDDEKVESQGYEIKSISQQKIELNEYKGYEYKEYTINTGSLFINVKDSDLLVNVFDLTEVCDVDIRYQKRTYKIVYRIPGYPDVVDKYLFKQEVVPYVPNEVTGYIFIGWDLQIPETMPSNDLVINGKYESNDNTIFYIKYNLENELSANYIETFSVKGKSSATFVVESNEGLKIKIIDETVLYETTKAYNGYTYDSYIISDNVCNIYFKLNEYSLIYQIDGKEEVFKYKYLQEIPAYNPIKNGYTLIWDNEIPELMPANDLIITGKFNPNSYKLTLNYGNKTELYIYKCDDMLVLPQLKDPIDEFLGWVDASGKQYEVMPGYDLQLNSSWKEYKRIVSYQIEGMDSFYLLNSNIDVDNIYIIFTYESGENEKICINDLAYTGTFNTASIGINEIIVVNQNQQITLKYEVSEEIKKIIDVQIGGFPIYFYLNEVVNLDDYFITITYTNEIIKLPLNDNSLVVSGFDTETSGYKVITIGYYSETLSIPYQVVNPIVIANNQILSLNKTYSFIVNVNKNYLPDNYDLDIKKDNRFTCSWVKNENGSFVVTVELLTNDVDITIGINGIPCTETINIKVISIDDLKLEISGTDYALINNQTGLYVIAYYKGIGYKLTDVEYVWGLSGYGSLNANGNYGLFTCDTLGISVIKVKVSLGSSIQTITKEIETINPYSGISFVEDIHYGIGQTLTLAGFRYNSSNKKTVNNYTFNIIYKGGSLQNSNLKWYTSDESIASFGLNGELNINGTGYVTLYATSKEAYKYNLNDSNFVGSFTVKCVYDTVLVSTYKELKLAFEENNPVVLANSIDVGTPVMKLSTDNNGNVIRTKLDGVNPKYEIGKCINQITSTWDCDYLINIGGLTIAPSLNYCLEITNNLYGNGYTLDCYQITTASSIDSSVNFFNGPLNLVSLLDAAAVKGQDNIGFLVRDNVTIDNVILQNCDDGYLYDNNMFVYSKLEKVGTTVEVMGDNVNIINSRLKNGRNVLRIYGTENNDEVINVNVESCILSNAREFLIKIGANKSIDANSKVTYNGESVFVNDLYDELGVSGVESLVDNVSGVLNELFASASPYLKKPDGSNYSPKTDENQYNNEFVSEYVKTFVTLKNSVLENTGFFAIGLESKFAGPILGGYRYAPKGIEFDYKGSYNISGTSYAALLRIEGDVRIYNWKKLSDINSSSLMEKLAYAKVLEEAGYDFTFDVKQLLYNVSLEKGYEDIISTVDGEKYAHGGIVFYGGGRNYHMLNLEKYTGKEFKTYLIDSSKMGDSLFATVLPWAAGKEPFRFFMFDSNSEFSYEYQKNQIETGNAYSWITPVK